MLGASAWHNNYSHVWRVIEPSARRRDRALSGYLFHCMKTGVRPGFGLGARPVALFAAAHASVCGSHTACAGRASPQSGERLKRGLHGSK